MSHRSLLSILAFCVIGLVACATPPLHLDQSWKKPTAKQYYYAEIMPVEPNLVINRIHAWEVRLTNGAGEAVTGARIFVDGRMPQHLHGFPTRPRVTKELGDGRYLIEGMKFSMNGWWEIKLAIETKQGKDSVTFNVVLPT